MLQEGKIVELKDTVIENTQWKDGQNKAGGGAGKEWRLRDSIKWSNIHGPGAPKGNERDQGKKLYILGEIMAENNLQI